MKTSFSLIVTSPLGKLLEAEVVHLGVLTAEGYMGVLRDHAPMFAALKQGPITLTKEDTSKHTYVLSGGLFKVQDNQAYLLIKDVLSPSKSDT